MEPDKEELVAAALVNITGDCVVSVVSVVDVHDDVEHSSGRSNIHSADDCAGTGVDDVAVVLNVHCCVASLSVIVQVPDISWTVPVTTSPGTTRWFTVTEE